MGLGLGITGGVMKGADSVATSFAGQLVTSTENAFTGVTGAQTLQKDFQAKKYLKLGAIFAGGVALSLVAALCPTILPFFLTGLTVGGDLNVIKDLAEQLMGAVDNQEQMQYAVLLAGAFFNSAKTDLEGRWQNLTEQHQLKQDILESKNPTEHLSKLKSVGRQQCSFFAQSLTIGKESAVAAELRQVNCWYKALINH